MTRPFDLHASCRMAVLSVEQRIDAHLARDGAKLEAQARRILESGGSPGLEIALGCGRPRVVNLADPERHQPPPPAVFPDFLEVPREYAQAPDHRRLLPSLRYADLARKTDERYAAAVVKVLASGHLEGPRLSRRHWRARLADWTRALADRIDP